MPQEAPGAARVHTECLDQVNLSTHRSVAATPPAVILLTLILGDSVPLSHRLAWSVTVCITAFGGWLVALTYIRRRRRGATFDRWIPGVVSNVVGGLAWSSAAIIAFPPDDKVELRAILALFMCAVSSTNIVGAAASRLSFFAFQTPLMAILTTAFIFDGDRVTRLIGLAIPVYFATMVGLYLEVNRKFVSEITLKYHNEGLIADAQAANDRLTEMVMRDSLTGLANRTALAEVLERSVALARRDGHVVGVLYFDLDRFKNVNDSLGHTAGDQLLIEVANRVATTLREHDVLARLGGDEFVVLVDRLGDSYEAYLIAERVRRSFDAPFSVLGRAVHVTPSIGVATNLHQNDGAEELLRHADAAQYRAKESGRNRVEVFDVEFRASLARRLDDERLLIEALGAGQIVPYFQPQIDLATGRIVGAEALARWVHPERGVLGAPHFIPLAEETGLITQVDDVVIAQAIRARVRLEELGAPVDFKIWCNISPRHFARVEPVARLAGFLEHAGCAPGGIGVEITETAVLSDMDAAARELGEARRLGIAIALDDFGTGHSSLTMLQRLPIDEVKIDQEFVRDLGVDPTDTAIVKHVASLARDLGLTIVAEGVQHQAQAVMLEQFGCHRAQGFLYSPAVALRSLAEMLERQIPATVADV
jgi:diguanylate cyclase (GGDEF)-like protein